MIEKPFFSQNKTAFLEFLLSSAQTVDRGSNLRTCQRKSFKRAIECAFEGRCSSSGCRVMCRFVEKCWKRQNLNPWWPLVTWPDLKIDRNLSVTLFDALSIAAYVSLRCPGAELEGEGWKRRACYKSMSLLPDLRLTLASCDAHLRVLKEFSEIVKKRQCI